MLKPNFLDQKTAFDNQFTGMSTDPFTYADFETTRERLIAEIHDQLTEIDRAFLISFKSGSPDWTLVPLPALADMPAVKWKLLNIRKIIKQNPRKHAQMLKALEKALKI